MSDLFILGAYWRARAEDVDVCADRTVRFFEELAPIDEGLAECYGLGGRSRRAVPPPEDQEQWSIIRTMLLDGQHRKDRTGEVMEQLGFSLDVWNGDWEADAALRIHCGAYTARSGGSVVLEFPTRRPEGFAHPYTSVRSQRPWFGQRSSVGSQTGCTLARIRCVRRRSRTRSTWDG